MPRVEPHRVHVGGGPVARLSAGIVLVAPVMLTIDAPVHQALQAVDDALTDRLGVLFFLGGSTWYLVPLGIGVIVLPSLRWLAWRRRRRAALTWGTWLCTFAFVAIASSALLATVLEYGVGPARPSLFDDLGPFAFEPLTLDAEFAALPSGHANTIFAVGLILAFLRPGWRALWLGAAAWIAFGRVLIGAHYVGDAVAGALLAAPASAARSRDRLRAWVPPQLPLVRGLAPAMATSAAQPMLMSAVGLREATPPGWPGRQAAPLGSETGVAPAEVELSVVVPVRDEAPNIDPLLDEIHAALEGEAFEVIYVDDGSRDGTAAALRAARARYPRLRCLRHAQSCGQSAAIRTGVLAARAEVVVTLDGDGQNDPADIPRLLALLRDPAGPPHLGMVAGQRVSRRDSWIKRRASVVANGVRRRLLGDGIRDTGCGLKVITRDTFLLLPYFDHMHRFLPALVQREGRAVRLVDVAHRPRVRGRSKYGVLDRLGSGLIDLCGVIWLMRRRRPPSITESEGET